MVGPETCGLQIRRSATRPAISGVGSADRTARRSVQRQVRSSLPLRPPRTCTTNDPEPAGARRLALRIGRRRWSVRRGRPPHVIGARMRCRSYDAADPHGDFSAGWIPPDASTGARVGRRRVAPWRCPTPRIFDTAEPGNQRKRNRSPSRRNG